MATRNPPWTRDELILALDLYMTDPLWPPSKNSSEILELSQTLNKLGVMLGTRGEKYRNPNGVYMKLMNFRRFDSRFIAAGKVGLTRGGKTEEEVWKYFGDDHSKLRATAGAIKAAIVAGEIMVNVLPVDEDDETAEAEEGRILTSVHRRRERSQKLVEQRKRKAMRDHGRLSCEACGFDFERTYGKRGHGFIECHHTKPVHTLTPNGRTRLNDLALLCSNCHRMVHTGRPWLTVNEVRELLKNAKPHQLRTLPA